VPAGEIVNQITALVKKGFKEVVLTGVDLTDYGKGLPGSLNLTALVRKILKLVPALERLRLSSLDPMEMDESLISLFGDEPRLLPSVHLSIQSGNNLILKRMKRRHQREDVIEVCEKLREKRPEITFGADLIVGFPTENEEMFEDTRLLVREAKITQLHVFPYSQRDGTPAQKMPQVPNQERKRRAKVLRSDGVAQLHLILDEGIGSIAKVLIENNERGHCERFLPVKMNKTYQTGEIVNTRIIARDGNYWIGEGI
ncbi:MAG: radical SAM protein, partial [Alphaproteobacteria bacterium]